jgi:type I restriction enzyme S subunit
MSGLARVAELAEQIRGVTYAKEDAVAAQRPGYLPVLRAGNITDDGLVFDDLVYVPAQRIADAQKIRRNDVLIATSSGSLDVVGKAARAVVDFDGGFGAFCKVLRPGPDVDPAYFAHFFRTTEYRKRVSALAAGANINNLRNEHLDDFQIPLPPVPEQRRIAEILDKADALRAKRRAALAQLDTLTQSIFLDMFGDPATNPKGWPRFKLRELGKVKTGGTPPTAKAGMFGGSIPFVTPGDLECEDPIKRSVTEAGAAESVTVRPGATLVCCIGATIGKIGRAFVRSAFNQQINAVEWGESVNDTYGFSVLRFFKPTIIAWGASTTLPILKKSAFERIEIPVPDIELQREFEERSSRVDCLEKQSRMAISHCNDLFASLQTRAFRGEV